MHVMILGSRSLMCEVVGVLGVCGRDYGTDREKALYTPIDPNKGKDDRALFDHYHK